MNYISKKSSTNKSAIHITWNPPCKILRRFLCLFSVASCDEWTHRSLQSTNLGPSISVGSKSNVVLVGLKSRCQQGIPTGGSGTVATSLPFPPAFLGSQSLRLQSPQHSVSDSMSLPFFHWPHLGEFVHFKEHMIRCKSAMYVGEGNGTPLQYSCLENPLDGEAW